jgi:hypothetical protein
MPSVPEEEVQPAALPLKPRDAAGGYLLTAAPAAVANARAKARVAATTSATRRGGEGGIGFSSSLVAPGKGITEF